MTAVEFIREKLLEKRDLKKSTNTIVSRTLESRRIYF